MLYFNVFVSENIILELRIALCGYVIGTIQNYLEIVLLFLSLPILLLYIKFRDLPKWKVGYL